MKSREKHFQLKLKKIFICSPFVEKSIEPFNLSSENPLEYSLPNKGLCSKDLKSPQRIYSVVYPHSIVSYWSIVSTLKIPKFCAKHLLAQSSINDHTFYRRILTINKEEKKLWESQIYFRWALEPVPRIIWKPSPVFLSKLSVHKTLDLPRCFPSGLNEKKMPPKIFIFWRKFTDWRNSPHKSCFFFFIYMPHLVHTCQNYIFF